VGSPLFQAPVVTFMEANCLIFDPALDDCKEYRELHGAYCALVTVLLDAFRQDTSLTHEQVIKAMTEMSRKTDLREVFSGLFELILATESFRLFGRLMTQKNLELQQQALMLIMKQYGQIPEIMQTEQSAEKPAEANRHDGGGDKAPEAVAVKQQEAEILNSIMKSAEPNKPPATSSKEAEGMKKSAEAEATFLKVEKQQEQQKLEQAMKDLKFEEPPSSSPAAQAKPAASKPALPRLTNHAAPPPTPVQNKPSATPVAAPVVGGGDAAAQWIAQAKAENDDDTVNAVQNAAATFATMTPEELQKRQQHLKAQREKLMALKQKEREKQLDTYEKKTPGARPKSARVARSVLSRAPAQPDPQDAEKNKEMEMRRAIANRLKAEMLENQF